MPLSFPHRIDTTDPDQTDALARAMGRLLRPGDTLLLDGPIGAGKTHFARALIRAAQGPGAEDVPSPTFTLVQTYDTERGEIWHADLYRLGDMQEIAELGLEEAMQTAICLIEWPDRLGPLAPEGALRIGFAVTGESARRLTLDGSPAWVARLGPVAAHAGQDV